MGVVAASLMVGGCSTAMPLVSSGAPTSPPASTSAAAVTATASAPPAPAPASKPSPAPKPSPAAPAVAAHPALPAGDQWVGSRSGHVRFAVPDTWLVIDPSKLNGPAISSAPAIKDLAARMGISPTALAAQMRGLKLMATSGRSRTTAELTDPPLSVMPSDDALASEIGTLTGNPDSVQVVHQQSRFGDMAVTQYTMRIAGLTRPVKSDLAMYVVHGQVWMLTVAGLDAPTVDRTFKQAVDTFSAW